jgi:O-antigen ligase
MLGGLALLGISLYVAYPGEGNMYSKRLMDTFNMDEGGNATRGDSWGTAFAIWRTNPVFGVGLGQLGGSPVKYGVAQLAPESTYLKTLGETGVVGMGLYLLAVLPPIIGAIGRTRIDTRATAQRAQRDVSIVIAILVGGLFLQNVEYDFFAGIFWLWLGGLSAYARCGLQLLRPEAPLWTVTR